MNNPATIAQVFDLSIERQLSMPLLLLRLQCQFHCPRKPSALLALLLTLFCTAIGSQAHAATQSVFQYPDNVNTVDGATSATAYHIATLGNLVWLHDEAAADRTLYKYYRLTQDIDASDSANWNDDGTTTDRLEGFTPIGTQYRSFNGIFLGNRHSISGLVINRPSLNDVGLFGATAHMATICDLTLDHFSISGNNNTAALVGYCYAKLLNCSVNASVSGRAYVGGLLGNSISSQVDYCHSSGTVSGSGGYVGGLVGYGEDLNYCDSSANVIGNGMVGGLLGYGTYLHYKGLIACHASGNVISTNGDQAGGLVGYAKCSIVDSYATGHVTGKAIVGGFAGRSDNLIHACYATGNAFGQTDVGGLVGSGGCVIRYSYATGDVQASYSAGGLVGSGGTQIDNCAAMGIVCVKPTTTGGSLRCGGLEASNSSTIVNSYASGGAMVIIDSSASNAYSIIMGGLVAVQNGNVQNCYANGPVRIVDKASGQPLQVPGAVLGGLTALTNADAVNLHSYWDVQSTGLAVSATGVGLSTLEMQQSNSFEHWDFSSAWGQMGSYPFIRIIPTMTLTYKAGSHGMISNGLTAGVSDVVQLINRCARAIPVTAVPNPNFLFARWSDGVGTNPRVDSALATGLTVTALYIRPTLLPNLRCAELPITINHRPTWFWNSYQGATIFRYQLDGQSDSAWTVTSATSWIPATSLPLGTHTLYVQEMNLSGQWSFSAQSTIRISTTTATQHWSAYE